MTSLKKGKPLKRQAREVITNVYVFMKKEAQEAKDKVFSKEKFQKVMNRTEECTGVSRKTIARILKEKDCAVSTSAEPGTSTGPSFRTPKKGRCKKTYRLNLDNFAYQAIRRKIHNSHVVEKQVVTIKSLFDVVQRDLDFTGSRETLRRIVKELGFKFKKTGSNGQILAEKDEVRLQRIKYLRQVKRFRHEGRDIIYADKAYVHSTHTKERSWADKSRQGIKNPISKGIVHAGGVNGFVPNALLIYKSNQTTGDYHSEMNKENYEKWLQEKLIPNLRPNSVLVTDNTSYHCTLEDRVPNSNSTKKTMQNWLVSKNIAFDPEAFKPELYNIIKQHKHHYVKYTLNTLMEKHGHAVLRVPPYHPDFNPIENIWAQLKGHVSKCNVGMNLTEVVRLLNEKFGHKEWQKVVDHAIKCEDEFMTLEEAIDDRLDQLIVNANDDSSTSFSDSSSDSDNGNDNTLEIEELLKPRSNECTERNAAESASSEQPMACNRCNQNIIGPRLVCVECSNLTICVMCDATGAHAHHYMLRIPAQKPLEESIQLLKALRRELGLADSNEGDEPLILAHKIKEEKQDPLEEVTVKQEWTEPVMVNIKEESVELDIVHEKPEIDTKKTSYSVQDCMVIVTPAATSTAQPNSRTTVATIPGPPTMTPIVTTPGQATMTPVVIAPGQGTLTPVVFKSAQPITTLNPSLGVPMLVLSPLTMTQQQPQPQLRVSKRPVPSLTAGPSQALTQAPETTAGQLVLFSHNTDTGGSKKKRKAEAGKSKR